MKTNKMPNELITEKSPYLLQHAYNPVNWYGWREAAFRKAKEENKPIFLSIGYSTCHWCHVMEKESFEDQEVAEIMNKHFIAIKVDREERPDIDSVYMTVCHSLTGQGGWPLTIIMTPNKKPFFAGTYFPKTTRYNRPGLIEILEKIGSEWERNQERFIKSSEEIMEALQHAFVPKTIQGELTRSISVHAVRIYRSIYDKKYGGFGDAPKFPSPHNLMFLMKYYQLEEDDSALEMVENTLKSMYRGGLFDHIGFGFARYSTDPKWLAPHFEKMLYDNALLIITYLEAYQITHNRLYKDIATKTITYVLRELQDESGGFYSAQDADSEGEEGKFYVFNPLETLEILGEEDGAYFNAYFDITPSGNFEGKSIVNLIDNEAYDKEDIKINELRQKVFDYRLERTHLHKDDKILTSWNALMIVALAKAYKILREKSYLKHAKECIAFIQEKLTNTQGRLLARYREGSAEYLGYLDDYAFLTWAFIEMYEVTFESHYLKEALKLNEDTLALFWDEEEYGFFLYGKDGESLIARPKELYDGAMPSGNSVAAYNLIKLAKLTGEARLEELAEKQLKVFTSSLKNSPIGHSFYMLALMFVTHKAKELVCVLKDKEDLENIKDFLSKHFMPNVVIVVKYNKEIEDIVGYLKGYDLKEDETTYYVCENNSCKPPFNRLEQLESILSE